MPQDSFDASHSPISDDHERLFSLGRDLIHYRRSRLIGDGTEACTCLRHRYGNSTAERVKTNKMDRHGDKIVYEQVEAFNDEEPVQDAYSSNETL